MLRKMTDYFCATRRIRKIVAACATVILYVLLRTKSGEVRVGKEPLIYAITPTYSRIAQRAEVTRLSHLFRLVPNLFWVIVEDADETSALVKNVVKRAGLENRSVVLSVRTPEDKRPIFKFPYWTKFRGVEQRNVALRWVRDRIKEDPRHGIVYFMDDDNTYSVELFKEMVKIKRGSVGIWGVGLSGGLRLERPIVKNGHVVGFNSMQNKNRPFPIDMAGFAISCDLLTANPAAQFNFNLKSGFQESEILKQLTTLDKLQPLGVHEVMVWHTKTERLELYNEARLAKKSLAASDAKIVL